MSEPPVEHWLRVPDAGLAARVASTASEDGRLLLLIDGRSGAGKTTLARMLAGHLSAGVVHIDDVSWHLHPTSWVTELVTGVLGPWSRGEAVDYRPPGWERMGRPGSIALAATPRLIVEGVGAGRRELAERANLVAWVQSDGALARVRGVERDIELGRARAEAEAYWDEWAASEGPFLDAERPWERAELLVNGTPAQRVDGFTEVAAGPLLR